MTRGPAILNSVYIQADLSRCLVRQVLWVVKIVFAGYKHIQGGFEELWNIVARGRWRNRWPLGCSVRGVSMLREAPRNSLFLSQTRRSARSALHQGPFGPYLSLIPDRDALDHLLKLADHSFLTYPRELLVQTCSRSIDGVAHQRQGRTYEYRSEPRGRKVHRQSREARGKSPRYERHPAPPR
jgi:hypothetical protein